MKDPARLCDQGELPSSLGAALAAAPGEPSGEELATLSVKLGGVLGLPLAAPPAAKAAAGLALSGTTAAGVAGLASKPALPWLTWVLGGVAVGVGLSAAATWSAAALTASPPPATSAPRAPEPSRAAPSKRDALGPLVAASVAPSDPISPLTSARPSSLAPSAAASEQSELSVLREARRALEHDPSRTLALCAEHARAYARGALGQERDVLRIDALLRLGRVSEARTRFAEFTRRHPDSAHAPRLRARLEEKIDMTSGRP